MKNNFKKIYKKEETVDDHAIEEVSAFAKDRLCLIKIHYSFPIPPTFLTGCSSPGLFPEKSDWCGQAGCVERGNRR